MLAGIVGLYLLRARRRAPNRYRIHGTGANAADMKPNVDTAQAPVRPSITVFVIGQIRVIPGRRCGVLTLDDHKGNDSSEDQSE